MSRFEEIELGRVAFNAYFARISQGSTVAVSAENFDALPLRIKDGWIAAGLAVKARCCERSESSSLLRRVIGR